jgi:hypothetical protein
MSMTGTIAGRLLASLLAPWLDGARLKNLDLHRGGAGLGEVEGQGKAFALLQRGFEADQHDVEAAGLKFDSFAGRKINPLDRAHAHDVALDDVGMHLGPRRHRAGGFDETIGGGPRIVQGHISRTRRRRAGGCPCPGLDDADVADSGFADNGFAGDGTADEEGR